MPSMRPDALRHEPNAATTGRVPDLRRLMPVVSIVTPSYNQAQFLPVAMQSVLKQDYPYIEYLVIDGGSTDGSREVIEGFASRLAFACSRPDGGQADALHQGFSRATGEILGWLNADDLLLPGAIRRVAEYFAEHPEVEAATGGAYSIDASGRPLNRTFGNYTLGVRASYNRLRFYAQDGLFQQATFWRRSAYEAVGGVDPNWQFIMDLDLFSRLACRRRFGRIPGMLACFRFHGASKSASQQAVRQQELLRFRQKHGQARWPAALRALWYWRYRGPSLLRKAWLATLRTSGVVRLAPVDSSIFFSGPHRAVERQGNA